MSADFASQNQKSPPEDDNNAGATAGFATHPTMALPPPPPPHFHAQNATPFTTETPPVFLPNPTDIDAPMAVASKYIDDFLQTLQSPTQRTAFKRDAEAFLSAFVKSYCEQKSIEKAKGDVSYCPKNCKVKVPFQPTERVSKSAAYQALVAEATDVTTTMSKTVTDLYLRCRILNYEDRKTELIEFFAKSLSRFAELVIVECGLSNDVYDKFDLVADLLFHKFNYFAQSLGMNLKQFAEIFRTVNNCGDPLKLPKTITTIMNEYFPEINPQIDGPPKDNVQTPLQAAPPTNITQLGTNTSHKTNTSQGTTTTPRSSVSSISKGSFITASEVKTLKDTLAKIDTNNPDDIENVTTLLNRFYETEAPSPVFNPVSLFSDNTSRSPLSSTAEDNPESLEPASLSTRECFCKRISSVDSIRTHSVQYERPPTRTIQQKGTAKAPHFYSQLNFPYPPQNSTTQTALRKLFDVINHCFFLPKKLYIQQDQYNEREQALMKISIKQGLEDTIEKTTTTLLESDLTDDPSKLMGASIDSKLSKIDEEAKRRLQSLESRIEENTNKRFKRIEELLANIAPASTQDPKARGGPQRGAPPKKSTHARNVQATNNRSWNRSGQANGPGRGRGHTSQVKKTVTFNVSRNQSRTEDSLTATQPPQQRRQENQDVIHIDSEQDSTNAGWTRVRRPSDNVPPSSLNDGWGR